MDEAALRNLVLAGIRDMIEWLYEEGPDPKDVPRDWLIDMYQEDRARRSQVVKGAA